VEEALETLAGHGENAKVIAGGQSLGPLLNLRLATPTLLVDVNRVDGLDGTRPEGDWLVLGALARQRVTELDPLVATRAPLVVEALACVGHPAIRNRGTVGGSIAHADPAAELPAVAVALDLEVVAASVRGRRVVPARDFFLGPYTTALDADELLLELRIPPRRPGTGHAWLEAARRHGDFALVGAAASLTLDASGRVAEVRLVLSGVGPVPVEASKLGAQLVGRQPTGETIAAVAREVAERCDPRSDVHASATTRRRIARALIRRALEQAAAKAEDA
jgi:aerobic carbon-monoxide dehydrogenase medium subunit